MQAALFALALAASPASEPILLDGRCNDVQWQGATATPIGPDAQLLTMASPDYVYLCIPLPAESLGTLDLFIDHGGAAPVNLHVSAQTGERTRTTSGWPEWSGFNNYDRWYGPPVAFAGFAQQADGTRAPTFADSTARELQLERSRFTGNEWRIALQLRALNADRNGAIDLPADANIDDPTTWATLTLP